MCIFLLGDTMLKKVNLFMMCFLLMCTVMQIKASEETNLSYRIVFDSAQKQEALVIQDILETYQRLTRTVKKKSRMTIVVQHLDEFKQNEEDEVQMNNGVLTIVQGDGKGTVIEGNFHSIECGTSIETSSWILELLNK